MIKASESVLVWTIFLKGPFGGLHVGGLVANPYLVAWIGGFVD